MALQVREERIPGPRGAARAVRRGLIRPSRKQHGTSGTPLQLQAAAATGYSYIPDSLRPVSGLARVFGSGIHSFTHL